ncbi:MAG: SLC13 family permease [Acetivibrionales bacterium]
MSNKNRIVKLLLGPITFFLCYYLLPSSVFVSAAARSAIGTVIWMAFWWVTAPVDYAVTAFLPIVINSVIKMADMNAVSANYSSEIVILLLGASILTTSWDETGLDKRIATKFLSLIGCNLRHQIIFWFLLSATLSAILPNAVVCAAITPIAVSMLKYVGDTDIASSKRGSLILLTIVYATGVGGLATPLGGAMNLVTVDYLQKVTGQEYMYTSWVIRFLPIMIVLVVSNIIYLILSCKKTDELGRSKEYFVMQYRSMPPMKREEKWSLFLFLLATVLSFSRQLYQAWLPGLKPAYIFIICAVLSFLIRRETNERLMIWKIVQTKVVWELIFVFGGGLAAGTLIDKSGASEAIGQAISRADLSGGLLTVFVIVAFTVILSDVTSNTATAAVSIPIVISIVNGMGKNPIPYIYIASIGINLSYMLPTSIRAIPVGYGLSPKYMLKMGVPLTIIVIVLMTAVGYLLLTYWPAFSTT